MDAAAVSVTGEWPWTLLAEAPWWLALVLAALVALRSEHLAAALAAMLAPVNPGSFAAACAGVFVAGTLRRFRCGAAMEGRAPELAQATRAALARRRWLSAIALPFQPWRRGEVGSAARLARSLGPATALLILAHVARMAGLAAMAGGISLAAFELSPDGGHLLAVGVVVAAWITTRVSELLLTWTGRRRLQAALARLRHHEHWPAWFFYLPLVPYLARLAIKHRHPLAFTAINRGIDNGGGVVGESKARIMAALAPITPAAAATVLIPAGDEAAERAARAVAITREHPAFGLPVIVKPDAGQRGFSVRLIRDEADFEPYFAEMTRDAILQQYAPGPEEIGVMWVRNPSPDADMLNRPRSSMSDGPGAVPGTPASISNAPAPAGHIFSITRKVFPTLEADGKHTIERQIYAHPRYRRQADRFLKRLGPRRYETPQTGTRIKLAEAGNHCQGTMFLDGADLITPELAQAIDEIAANFPGPDGKPGGLDLGRFDLRFASYEDLKAGRNFAIVELNGATSESTNIYDPRGSLLWAYGYLFRQWRLMFALGAERSTDGARPLSVREFVGTLAAFYQARPGSDVSD